MKKILVTGATGFIGRHTLPFLLKKGYEIHIVSSRNTSEKVPRIHGIHHHSANILELTESTKLLEKIKPTHLLHLAWYAIPGKFWTAPENLEWVKATLHLLQRFAEQGGHRVAFAGTCAEYDWGFPVCQETETPTNPSTLYGVCKNSLFQIVNAYSNKIGLSYAWGRVFFLYGPHEYAERLVPYVITNLLKKSAANCSHGSQIRDFMHVEDVAEAFVELLDSEVQGPINIASGQETTLKNVIQLISTELNGNSLVQFGPMIHSPNDPPKIVADVTKLQKELQWKPKHTLEDGLKETIHWWRQQLKI